jgi:Flp pilus assembly pilin Flp
MAAMIRDFVADEDGATLIEYAFIIAFIALVAIGAASQLGTKLLKVFTNLDTQFPNTQ